MDLQLDPTSVTSGVGETTAIAQPLPCFPSAQGYTGLRQVPLTTTVTGSFPAGWKCLNGILWFRVDSSRSLFLTPTDPMVYWCSKQNDVAGFLVSQADHKLQSISQEMWWTHQLRISFQSKNKGRESENEGRYREISFGLPADKQKVGLSQKWGILQFSSSTEIVFSILTVLPQLLEEVTMQHNFERSPPHLLALHTPSQSYVLPIPSPDRCLGRVCIISIIVKCPDCHSSYMQRPKGLPRQVMGSWLMISAHQ